MAILPLAPGQDYLRVSRAGLLLAPNDPHRGGAVCSARQVKRGGTAVPDIDGSVGTRRSLISKQLFHRLHNPNPIASKTHEHKSVLVGRQGHRRTNVANTRSSSRGPRQELQSWHTSRKADTFAPVLPGGDIEARCLLEQVMLAGAEDEQVMPPPRAAPRRAASAHAPRRRGALRARPPRTRRGALRRAAARTCAPRRGR